MSTTKSSLFTNPGKFMALTFVILLAVNALIIHLANAWYPESIVLGTATLTRFWAVVLSSAVISLVATFTMPFVQDFEKTIKRPWAPHEMMAIYLAVNFVTVWLLTRVSQTFGLGVTSWMVVLWLSVAMDVLQGAVMVSVEKMKLSK